MPDLAFNGFGPNYPQLGPAVAKFRKIANPTAAQRRAHGDAVSTAVRELQRRELQRELPTIKPRCVSGTWCNGGDYADGHADGGVGRAIAAQQRRALLACPDQERRRRPASVWQAMYEAAMVEKRKRVQTTTPAPPELVALIRDYAREHYFLESWDLVADRWSDNEIAAAITGAKTRRGAIAKTWGRLQVIDRARAAGKRPMKPRKAA
jgi:hypothetical protein